MKENLIFNVPFCLILMISSFPPPLPLESFFLVRGEGNHLKNETLNGHHKRNFDIVEKGKVAQWDWGIGVGGVRGGYGKTHVERSCVRANNTRIDMLNHSYVPYCYKFQISFCHSDLLHAVQAQPPTLFSPKSTNT